MIDRVTPGDPLSQLSDAAWQNKQIDQINRNSRTVEKLVPLTTALRMAWFELTAPLTYPAQTAKAPHTDDPKTVYYIGYEHNYSAKPSGTKQLWYPLALRDGDGNFIGLPKLRIGMWVLALDNPQSCRWEIVAPEPQTTWPFELTENLTFGSNATANPLDLNGSYAADTDIEFEVYDPFSKFNQNCKPTGQGGARGYAMWLPDSGRFEIQEMQHQARWIKCIADGAFATTDETVTIDGVVYYDGYEPDTAVTTVYNAPASTNYIFEGDDDDVFYAKYDPAADKYWLDQGECP